MNSANTIEYFTLSIGPTHTIFDGTDAVLANEIRESLALTMPCVRPGLPYTAQFLLYYVWDQPASRNRRCGAVLRKLVDEGYLPLEAFKLKYGKPVLYFLK